MIVPTHVILRSADLLLVSPDVTLSAYVPRVVAVAAHGFGLLAKSRTARQSVFRLRAYVSHVAEVAARSPPARASCCEVECNVHYRRTPDLGSGWTRGGTGDGLAMVVT